MGFLAKLFITIFSATTFAGIGLYTSGLLNNSKTTIKKNQIKQKLIQEGFQLINNEENSNWKEILDAYKLATTKTFSGAQEKNKTESQLKSNCDSELIKNIEKEYRNNPIYSKVTQWCVKKEKMKVILTRSGFRILKFDSSDDQKEQRFLQNKIEKLKENNNQAFEALKLATGEIIKTGDEKNIETLKKGCEALDTKNLETINNEFLNNFYLAKDLCYINDQ